MPRMTTYAGLLPRWLHGLKDDTGPPFSLVAAAAWDRAAVTYRRLRNGSNQHQYQRASCNERV